MCQPLKFYFVFSSSRFRRFCIHLGPDLGSGAGIKWREKRYKHFSKQCSKRNKSMFKMHRECENLPMGCESFSLRPHYNTKNRVFFYLSKILFLVVNVLFQNPKKIMIYTSRPPNKNPVHAPGNRLWWTKNLITWCDHLWGIVRFIDKCGFYN